MKIGWISGWAVPAEWLGELAEAAIPGAEHVVFRATQDALAKVRAAGRFDWVVGYSLGSHVLLADKRGSPICDRVALLAPIWGFPSEAGSGGRISRTQVRALSRWLQRDAPAALGDFYRRAGLDIPSSLAPVAEVEALLWGLGCLEGEGIPAGLPAGWLAWCGANDALLDAQRLRELVPGVQIVPGATHHPAELIRRLAKVVA